MIIVSVLILLLAGGPALLFLCNLRLYRSPQQPRNGSPPAISVLIPARNEALSIGAAVASVLGNRNVELELIVLDDASTDRTAEIVNALAATDPRVRLEHSSGLPAGWCGKTHACHLLAASAKHPVMVFLDADVRLAPDALRRVIGFLDESGAALVSGVPRQDLGSFSERLLIPLIHFVLLGFLPVSRMRRLKDPALAAGCGQLMVVRRDAYQQAGGHAAIRTTLHDGIKLPRIFRQAGFATDLFDATEVAVCRMYRNDAEVWEGLGKNASEGLAAPARIAPVTLLLLGGQVMPWVMLPIVAGSLSNTIVLALAAALSLLPRFVAAWRFRQSWLGALLHPVGILALLIIQWRALFRWLGGSPAVWKGRSYPNAKAAMVFLTGAMLNVSAAEPPARFVADVSNKSPGPTVAVSTNQVRPFELRDQNDVAHKYQFPRTRISVMTVADHEGSKQLENWIQPIYQRYETKIHIDGVADVSTVPWGLKGTVRRAFKKKLTYPVMLDWEGGVAKSFGPEKNKANIFVIDRKGRIVRHFSGPATPDGFRELYTEIDRQESEKAGE